MHCGQQVDAATAAGSTFSEARLSGVIVVVGKVFNGDKDSSVVPRIPLVPSLVLGNIPGRGDLVVIGTA
jgi:hypothetical protein